MNISMLNIASHKHLPLLFRIPDMRSSIISNQNPALNLIQEKFQSLLQGNAALHLNTPSHFYTWIPTQHMQMNIGILNFLGFQLKSHKWIHQLSIHQFQYSHLLQALFQNLIRQGSLNSQQIIQNTSSEQKIKQQTQEKISQPEPAVIQRLQEVNRKRAQKGQSPIDLKMITQEIENIMSQTHLSDGDKKKQIAAIRKKWGLGKKDMKTLFTQRLKQIYQDAAQQIQIQIQNTADPAEKQRLSSLLQQYESKASLYNSMFKSFWSKLGGAFKKIGGIFKKVAGGIFKALKFASPFLKFIPGIGQISSLAQGLLSKAFGFFKNKFSKVIQPIQNFFNNSYGETFRPLWNETKTYLQNLIQI